MNGNPREPLPQPVDGVERRDELSFRVVCRRYVNVRISSGDDQAFSVAPVSEQIVRLCRPCRLWYALAPHPVPVVESVAEGDHLD